MRGARDAPGGLFHLFVAGNLQVNRLFRRGISLFDFVIIAICGYLDAVSLIHQRSVCVFVNSLSISG
jgi:hypothetical protein